MEQYRGPCIIKVQELRSPVMGVCRGLRILVASPNMEGTKPFKKVRVPSFGRRYLLQVSADFHPSRLRTELERMVAKLMALGHSQVSLVE